MSVTTETHRGIGASAKRKEDARYLTGQGRYVDDIKLPGMLHMVVVRSQVAHGTLTGIETGRALKMPGVRAVLTAGDLEFAAGVPCASNPQAAVAQPLRQPVRPPLATGKVRHVGEPVAVVIADDRYAARDAADAVEVSIDRLPPVIGVEAALADGAPAVHDEIPDNVGLILEHRTDGIDDAFANADVVVKQTLRNQRLVHGSIETRGVVADWVPASDTLTIYSSTQVPHFLRTFIAIVCGVSEAKVRAIAPDVGGGFGGKLNAYAEEFIAAAVSRKLGVPIKWIEERSEAMLATCHGRAQVAHMELAATKDGKLLGMRGHYVQDYGSYLQMLTPLISQLTFLMATGSYAIPEIHLKVTNVFTTTVPTDALRGAGRPEATYAIERMMDILARELGISRSEVRKVNFPTEFPFTSPIGLLYDSGDYHGSLDKLLELSDDKATFEQRRTDARRRGKLLGRGLSTWVEVCGFVPSDVAHSALGLTPGGWESSTVRLHPTGKVTAITGSSAHGQGHATTWSQIIESELGIPFDDVEVISGDTAFAPYGLGTYGSRSLAVGGTALQMAAMKVRDKAKQLAAHMMEASADDLELEDGVFHVKGSPDKSVTIQEVAFRAWQAFDMPEGMTPGLDETVFFDPPNCVFPFGAHGCEVEVDEETGKVEITGYIAVDDCGVVVNPMIVAGQVHGGVVHGIAQALYEEAVYDDEGQLLTGSFVDYLVPAAPDVPPISTESTVTPSPTNPLGVKGIGEAGTIASTPAVVNAVCDALGVKDIDMPLQPERVWRAMSEGGAR
jgi:carbon-monoxide dehydrogenase large subunit